MKYLLFFLLSFSVCFAEFEKMVVEQHIDTVDNFILRMVSDLYEVDDYLIFAIEGRHIDSLKNEKQLIMMKNNKVTAFNFKDYISNHLIYPNLTISGAVVDSKGVIWVLSILNAYLFRIENGEMEVIDYLNSNFKIKSGNGLYIDENDNIFIQSNHINLIKFDGINFELLERTNYDDSTISFPGIQNMFFFLDNKLFFPTLSLKLGYYDLIKKDYFAVNLGEYISDDKIIRRIDRKNDNFVIFYRNSANNVNYFAEYSFLENTFTNLDTLFKLTGRTFYFDSTNLLVDNDKYYLKRISSQADTVFVIDNSYNVRILDFYEKLNSNFIGIKSVLKTKSSKTLIGLASKGILVLKEASAVETPLNVLFVNNIYPNPAKQNVFIDFIVEPENLPNVTVELYNLTGVLQSKLDYIVDYNNANGQASLNCKIDNIPNGYYIIVIDNGKRKIAKPFIVNKD